jgi:uncharacterized protein YigE (DUF2233 family)
MLPRWLLTLLGFVSTATATLKASEKVEFQGALYHVHRIDKDKLNALELRWLGKDGQPLREFEGLRKALASEGKEISFATNAGIYEKGPKPCGLTICAGKELVPLSLKDAEGNFYLKPNGVFYVDDATGAGVMESIEYGRSGLKPRLATQSGPMLMRKGVLHPAFNVNSPNKRLRNAVGVNASTGQVIFVMSDRDDREKGRVTFHQLCQFFLHLGCKDALFLDGDISDMLVDPAKDAKLTPNTFAAMFLVPR